MSLFYAEATPMLKTLSDATTKFVSEVSVPQEVTFFLPADTMITASPVTLKTFSKLPGSLRTHGVLRFP